jgi:hypothetical protein
MCKARVFRSERDWPDLILKQLQYRHLIVHGSSLKLIEESAFRTTSFRWDSFTLLPLCSRVADMTILTREPARVLIPPISFILLVLLPSFMIVQSCDLGVIAVPRLSIRISYQPVRAEKMVPGGLPPDFGALEYPEDCVL